MNKWKNEKKDEEKMCELSKGQKRRQKKMPERKTGGGGKKTV